MLCAEDTFVLANACVACPAGSTNAAGDDPSGPDSVCDDACSAGFGIVRLDKRNVQVKVDGQRVDSGLRKFGAIVGDRAQTGCNAVLNPGSLLLPGAFVFPCASVDGLIEPR